MEHLTAPGGFKYDEEISVTRSIFIYVTDTGVEFELWEDEHKVDSRRIDKDELYGFVLGDS